MCASVKGGGRGDVDGRVVWGSGGGAVSAVEGDKCWRGRVQVVLGASVQGPAHA